MRKAPNSSKSGTIKLPKPKRRGPALELGIEYKQYTVPLTSCAHIDNILVTFTMHCIGHHSIPIVQYITHLPMLLLCKHPVRFDIGDNNSGPLSVEEVASCTAASYKTVEHTILIFGRWKGEAGRAAGVGKRQQSNRWLCESTRVD